MLLLDEPTAGMSLLETSATMELIKKLNEKEGISILFTEHDMSFVFGTAKRITVLHQGKIIAEGTPQQVRSDETVQKVYFGEESI
jgi:branched-chain amino acid transport system ATP-binding protein